MSKRVGSYKGMTIYKNSLIAQLTSLSIRAIREHLLRNFFFPSSSLSQLIFPAVFCAIHVSVGLRKKIPETFKMFSVFESVLDLFPTVFPPGFAVLLTYFGRSHTSYSGQVANRVCGKALTYNCRA